MGNQQQRCSRRAPADSLPRKGRGLLGHHCVPIGDRNAGEALCRQSSMASAFCWDVNRRRVLVGLVIEGQSGGHGVPPNDLSSRPGEPHTDARHQGSC